MPIKSYLAFSKPNELEFMVADLKEQQLGEVHVADGQPMALLVTDTPDDQTEKILEKKLNELSSIQCLTLVYGHSEGEAEAC